LQEFQASVVDEYEESFLLCIESKKFGEFNLYGKMTPKMFYPPPCQRGIEVTEKRDPGTGFFIRLKERPFPDKENTKVEHFNNTTHLL
jgi:hypothetical protein